MPRWTRILLTVMAAAFGGYAGMLTIGGTVAGFAWLYLFGDNVWPAWSDWLIGGVALIGLLIGACGMGLATWRATAKKRD